MSIRNAGENKLPGWKNALYNLELRVLDLGCGLRFDSFLAANYFNCELIAGVDLSKAQIEWCKERLQRSNTDDKQVKFFNADIETLGNSVALKDFKGTFSHVISNGAFCLLPNKKKGFQTAYEFLKDGGVMAICCTVIKDNDDNPVMVGSKDSGHYVRTFGKLIEVGKIAGGVGFKNVLVDTENSLMEYSLGTKMTKPVCWRAKIKKTPPIQIYTKFTGKIQNNSPIWQSIT